MWYSYAWYLAMSCATWSKFSFTCNEVVAGEVSEIYVIRVFESVYVWSSMCTMWLMLIMTRLLPRVEVNKMKGDSRLGILAPVWLDYVYNLTGFGLLLYMSASFLYKDLSLFLRRMMARICPDTFW